MQITTKGQVTIPKEFRDRLGMLPHTHIEFELVGEELRVRKARQKDSRGHRMIEQMAGRATLQMTTDEIMKLTRGE